MEERVNEAGVSFISLLSFVLNQISSRFAVTIVAFFGAGENKPPKGCCQKDCWSGGTWAAVADEEEPRTRSETRESRMSKICRQQSGS